MARFATSQGSIGDALNTIADKADVGSTKAYTLLGAVASITPTAAQMINGVLNTAAGSTITITTPTAALLVAAIPDCQVGYGFDVTIQNTNSGTATLAAGAGVTVTGTATAATATNRSYRAVVTNVATPAVTFFNSGAATN